MKFDELHQLKRFFSTMELSESEKKKRCDLAWLLYDAVWYTFTLYKVELQIKGSYDENSFRETLKNRISDAIDIPYDPSYVDKVVDDITETTSRHLDDPYYFSPDRAVVIAQNEANSVYNFADYDSAVKSGKKWKTWRAEIDTRTREAHFEVDGVRIPINENFIVGGEPMRYPHDFEASAENLVNCRCLCTYS